MPTYDPYKEQKEALIMNILRLYAYNKVGYDYAIKALDKIYQDNTIRGALTTKNSVE